MPGAQLSQRVTRFRLILEYDGSAFRGWQKLPAQPSVQGVLEDAVFALSGERVDIVGAGRTDAGVHARGQVAHVDVAKALAPQRLADALNALVRPHPISVLAAAVAAPEFHARFDAVRRVYLYRILDRRAPLALERQRAMRTPRRLDVDAMHRAAQRLVGRHDFTTFRDAQCQAKSPVRTLDRCDVLRVGEEIHIWCEARSFLHRQVRSIVGTLIEAGEGKMSADDVAAALAARDRAACGPVAPPDGLYLMRVDY